MNNSVKNSNGTIPLKEQIASIRKVLTQENVRQSLALGKRHENKDLTSDLYTYATFRLDKWKPTVIDGNLEDTEVIIKFWTKLLSDGVKKILRLQTYLPTLQKIALENSQRAAKTYIIRYRVRDLTSDLYLLAMSRLGRNWFPPPTDLEGISKAWGAYLISSFRHVIDTELKDDVIKKCSKNGETFTLIKQFEDGFPDWFEGSSQKRNTKGFNDILDILKKELTTIEYGVLLMRSKIFLKQMTFDSIAEWFNNNPAFWHLDMTKSKVHSCFKKAQIKAQKVLTEEGCTL